jgi:hypothetical protein
MQLESSHWIPRDAEKLLKLCCVRVNRAINKLKPPNKKSITDIYKVTVSNVKRNDNNS